MSASPLAASDAAVLPPDGLDLTLLGITRIPVEAAVVMIGATSIDTLAQVLRGLGVNDMRRTGIAPFVSSVSLGQEGYNDPSHGWYVFAFAAGTRAAMLICESTADTEAASRACEAPLARVVAAWMLNLTT